LLQPVYLFKKVSNKPCRYSGTEYNPSQFIRQYVQFIKVLLSPVIFSNHFCCCNAMRF